MKNDIWKRSGVGLYCYQPTGIYFARVRFGGKVYRRTLGTSDYRVARRKLAAYRNDLERTDASKGRTSFAAVLDAYERTLTGAESTLEKKRAVIAKLRATWFGLHSLPLRAMQFSDVKRWLSEHYAEKSASYYNSALSVVRSALEVAVNDKIISESPAKDLTYRKRKKPVRPTPTFEQFKQIAASIRAPPVKYWEIIADRLYAEG